MFEGMRSYALLGLVCLLTACGGGGGGDPTDANQPPVVRALASGQVQLDNGTLHASVGGTVTLDASGSTDADHDTLTYTWSLVSKPSGSTLPTTGSGPVLNWQPDVLGTYTFSVQVADGKGGSAAQQVTLVADNVAPSANVTVSAAFTAVPSQKPTQTVTVGGNVVIDATNTTDPDGDPVDVSFELLPPAGSTSTLTVTGRVARLSPDMLGLFQVRVRGTDGRGASFETLYSFQANNRAPTPVTVATAVFTAQPAQKPTQSVTVGSNIVVDATNTTDPDGDPVDVSFELLPPAGSTSALSVASRVAHFTPDTLGLFQVRVRGVDGRGASFETLYSFQANNRAPNPVTVATVQPVTADGGSNIVTTSVGYDVLLDSTGSGDPDNDTITRSWSLTARPAGSSAALQGSGNSVSISPDVLGDYTVVLTVTDSQGAKATKTAIVRANNRRPIAVLSTNATPQSLPSAPSIRVPLGTQLTLRGDASTDADGDVITYAWFVDARPSGSQAALSSISSASPIFTADAEGTYIFRLRVTDPAGAYSERSITVEIGTHAPVAVVDKGTITLLVGSTAQASASLSFDEDGDTLSFLWSIDGRPSGSTAALGSTTSSAASFTPDAAGTYVLAVRVSDGRLSSIAYVTVRALASVQNSVALGFAPGEAHYSAGLDRLVIASTNPNALREVDPFTGVSTAVALPASVKNFSLSPDGRLAAVLHEGVVTLIDLSTSTLLHSTSTGGSQTDAFVTNAGMIYLIGQTGGQWVNEPIVVIDGRTGTKITQSSSFYGGGAEFYGTQYGVLAGSLNKVFFLAQGLSPSNISWFSFSASSSQVVSTGESPYWGDYAMTSPMWLSSDDGLVFTAAGDYFRSDNLRYAGQLQGVTSISSFSHSASLQEALVLSKTTSVSYPYTVNYPSSYQRFTGSLLMPDTSLSLPQIGGQQSYGIKIFHSSNGSHIVLVQTGSAAVDASGVNYYVIAR